MRPVPLRPLDRLRLRLTVWYVATFSAILLLLGGGLFLVIRRDIAQQLDISLADATKELERAANIRAAEARSARGLVVDAVDELHVPERTLYLFDAKGQLVKPDRVDSWISTIARRALSTGLVAADRQVPDSDRTLRIRAERFRLDDGTVMVAAVVADEVELEDRYASLIVAFGSAALAAIVLVAAGGWLLVRQSTAPVERAVEHMRRFMADAAHELRTPLTVLRARAETTRQQERTPAEYAQTLEAIDGESQRLSRIVDDLLTLARADAGDRPVVLSRVFLDDIVLDAAEDARVVAQQRGVAVEIEQFEEAPIAGDATLLRQLVMILLDNALKFTPSGGRVRVRVGVDAAQPTLSISDSGVGIPAEQLPHVFERFYRGDPARSRASHDGKVEGVGLGLSIARWIVDAHKADIRIGSTPGSGTTVVVAFAPLPDS